MNELQLCKICCLVLPKTMLRYSVRFSNVRFNFYNTESIEELFFFGEIWFSAWLGFASDTLRVREKPGIFLARKVLQKKPDRNRSCWSREKITTEIVAERKKFGAKLCRNLAQQVWLKSQLGAVGEGGGGWFGWWHQMPPLTRATTLKLGTFNEYDWICLKSFKFLVVRVKVIEKSN